MENLMKFGEANFRCILVKSNACNTAACTDFNYHLMVVFNHSVADGTSGMILTNQIFCLYDEAIKNSDVLEGEINAEIVKTWQAAIQPNNPNGDKNYEKIQSEIDAGQANIKNFLIPYSFEMKGRNAHVLRKGTPAGLKAFKTACKNNGVTIGIGLITAVHWAMAKFDSSRDLFGYADVNLRHRLGDGADKYKGVSCNIGMFKISFDGKFDFDSGSVNFWELAQALKKNIDMQMADGNQFVFHRITEDRIMSGKEDLIDINISSIGHYPFATKFQNSGIKMNGNWTSMSGKISPDWGSCVLLVQSLEMQCYTVTYYNEGDNKAKATDFINMVVDLCENQMGSNENLKFSDWKPVISSAN